MTSAPLIYFEKIGVFDLVPGVIHLELQSRVSSRVNPDLVESNNVTVANLRCNVVAAKALVAMMQAAIAEHEKMTMVALSEMETPPQIGKPN